jgi:hypothetical protein
VLKNLNNLIHNSIRKPIADLIAYCFNELGRAALGKSKCRAVFIGQIAGLSR